MVNGCIVNTGNGCIVNRGNGSTIVKKIVESEIDILAIPSQARTLRIGEFPSSNPEVHLSNNYEVKGFKFSVYEYTEPTYDENGDVVALTGATNRLSSSQISEFDHKTVEFYNQHNNILFTAIIGFPETATPTVTNDNDAVKEDIAEYQLIAFDGAMDANTGYPSMVLDDTKINEIKENCAYVKFQHLRIGTFSTQNDVRLGIDYVHFYMYKYIEPVTGTYGITQIDTDDYLHPDFLRVENGTTTSIQFYDINNTSLSFIKVVEKASGSMLKVDYDNGVENAQIQETAYIELINPAY